MAETTDKKDVSILLEGQLPEFVTYEHPKFKKFIEKYYEFMESHELYFEEITFNEFKILPEDIIVSVEGVEFITYEDEDRIQLESERDTASNANLQFHIGETITGNTSGATAVVTGTKGNTHAFIKPTNEAVFLYGEQITGGTSRAYSTLANGISANVFPEGAIESFRSRGPVAATRELADMQDIDKTNEGLIDDAWKKEFYTNVPKTTITDRRQLLKRMKQVYRSKGNESSFTWVFRSIFAKEDVEFYYPKVDLMRLSDGRWTLDKTIKVIASTATNLELFTGRKITGASSKCTAMVERAITSSVGALLVTELYLSDVIAGLDDDNQLGFFKVNELITTETDIYGQYGSAATSGLVKEVSVQVGGTEYTIGDEISFAGGGGQDARARVASIADSVVEGITILDSGDGYSVGDVLKFIDEGTGGSGASGRVSGIITTGNVIINSDQISTYKEMALSEADYVNQMQGHNANTHLYANSSLIFQSTIKAASALYFDAAGAMWNSQFIKAGNQLRKQIHIDSQGATLTQTGTTVTLTEPLTESERRDMVGGKLTYANGNNTIITSYTNTTVFTVKDSHTIGSAQNWNMYYGSNTTWATIIGANSSQILYAVGSYHRDPALGELSVNNFANNDSVIVYDPARNKSYAAKSANSHDSQMTHTGVTFDIGNTPASQTVNSTSTISYVDAFGQSGTTTSHVTIGALNTTTKNVGAVKSCAITAGGEKYEASPVVTVTNGYMTTFDNALDVTGANNALINLNLHSYGEGTIRQTSNVVTLLNGTFPDANSGLLQLTYANGNTDMVTAVTNSTSIRVAEEKNFGVNDAPQEYVLTYMAIANNFTSDSYLYNDDYSVRARVLDYVDKAKSVRPPVQYGNTTIRLDMLTTKNFSATIEYMLMEDGDVIAYEDDPADGLFSGSSRVFTETGATAERITAYSNSISTINTGTITQTGFYPQQEDSTDGFLFEDNDKFISDEDTVLVLAGANFPNDLPRGTVTYADTTTATVTEFVNSTSVFVDIDKPIGSGQTYSINYNGVVTWGNQRIVTAAGSGTGNRTITVTDNGHYFRTGDKIKMSGCLTFIVNGTQEITVINSNTYSYTLAEDGIASPAGELRVRGVASAYLASYNTFTVDTSPKGNNATLEVSAIAIGAIKTVEVYNFGAGYTSVPTVSTTTGNKNAELSAVLGAFAEYAGYYVGGKGLISGTPKIQDNKYYQDFSYVLKTDFDVSDYRDSVKRLAHPSGMLMFGEVAFRNKVSAAMFDATRHGDINSPEANTGKTAATADVPRYRLTVPTINSYANVQHKPTSGYASYLDPKGGIIELQTARHSWQAMDGRIDVRGDENLLYEDFRDITMQRTSAIGTSAYATITDPFHNVEVGDTIQVSGDRNQWGSEQKDHFNGKYTVYSVPNGNTYTVQLYRGDPGTGVSASAYLYVYLEDESGQMLLETGDQVLDEYSDDDVLDYIKVETLEFANVYRANTSNWEAPFNNAPIDELDGEKFLLEHGGSFLYPLLKFPTPESGSVTIDMSFNSDVLLEDNNEEGSGYLLDEASGGQGQGPARFISLEEDTEGDGHQYLSIPYQETHVEAHLQDSMRYGFLTEDGQDLVCEDDIYSPNLILEDGDFYITLEDGFGQLLSEDEGRIMTEDWIAPVHSHISLEDGSGHLLLNTKTEFERLNETHRLITEQFPITNGSYYPVVYIDHLSSLGKIRTEDNCMILMENGKDYIRVEVDYNIYNVDYKKPEFHLYENAGYNLILEDDSHLIIEGDETSSTLSRFQTEESHAKLPWHEIEYEINFSTSILGKIQQEDDSDFIINEDNINYIELEQVKTPEHIIQYTPSFSTSIIGKIQQEDNLDYIMHEDDVHYIELERRFSLATEELQLSMTETTGWHLMMEDDITHHIYEDESRVITEEGHIKPSHTEYQLEPGQEFEPSTIANTFVVQSSGSPYAYIIDGVSKANNIVLQVGKTYKFDLSHSSMAVNVEHPFYFSTLADGPHTQSTSTKFEGRLNDTWYVKVSSSVFYIDRGNGWELHPTLIMEQGVTYRFDLSDSSMSGHPFRLSTTFNGSHNSGAEFTTGKTVIGTPGNAGAYVEYTLDGTAATTLYYYCTAHSDKTGAEEDGGAAITVRPNNDPRWQEYGTIGEAGAYATLRIEKAPSTIYYYCHNHAAMGGQMTVEDKIVEYNYAAIQSLTSNYMVPTRLQGGASIPHLGTTMTGHSSSFTTELAVGDEFQTEEENFKLDGEEVDIMMESDERLEHEDMMCVSVQNDVIGFVSGVQIRDFRWMICSEDSTIAPFAAEDFEGGEFDAGTNQEGVQGTFDPDPAAATFNMIMQDSSSGRALGLEDTSGTMIHESSVGFSILLEDGEALLITDPQEFKIASITNDTSAVVTRRHIGGTDSVPYFKKNVPLTSTSSALYSNVLSENISLQSIVTGLESPTVVTSTGVRAVPDSRIFITEQAGKIRIVKNGSLLGTPFLDITSAVQTLTAGYDERGLLGLAFHPNFKSNGKYYVYYSKAKSGAGINHESIVAMYVATLESGNYVTSDVSQTTETIILRFDQPTAVHNGGSLSFGSDGYLYIATGDGGSQSDPDNKALDRTSLLGKILRINVDSGSPYSIPNDNPYKNHGSYQEEIYAYGFRNPWRMSHDWYVTGHHHQTGAPTYSGLGTLWVGDVGQSTQEEINQVVSGGNYGWSVMEGTYTHDASRIAGWATQDGVTNQQWLDSLKTPVATYTHSGGTVNGLAVVGGYVYRGSTCTDLIGKYVFGDWSTSFSNNTGKLYYLNSQNAIVELNPNQIPLANQTVIGFGTDNNNELYVITKEGYNHNSNTTGKVYKFRGNKLE